jgi:hypothetical protein
VRLSFGRSTAGGGSGPPPDGEPISRTSRSQMGGGCLAGFFAIFLLVGLGIFLPFFGLAAWRSWQARGWTEVPCTVLESHVETHPGDDGATYSIEIRYRYHWGSRTLVSDRYDFLSGSSSGYAGKAEVVAAHPAGSACTCWIDPADPTQAVFEPRFTTEYLFGLLPLFFVAVGAGGMVFALTAGRQAAARERRPAPWLPEPAVAEPPADEAHHLGAGGGPVELKARMGPVGKLVVIVLIALFWNGIVGVFVWQLVASWRAGSFEGCLALFLLPFVLIGLALLAGVPYQLLALANPRPLITLGTASPRLGEATRLDWRFRGRAGRIRRLTLTLEGQEKATYRRGTDTVTSTETFARLTLLDTEDPAWIGAGSVELEVPADTMHSFDAPNNKIVWTLKIAGTIRRWPDVADEFALTVRPLRPERAGGPFA